MLKKKEKKKILLYF